MELLNLHSTDVPEVKGRNGEETPTFQHLLQSLAQSTSGDRLRQTANRRRRPLASKRPTSQTLTPLEVGRAKENCIEV